MPSFGVLGALVLLSNAVVDSVDSSRDSLCNLPGSYLDNVLCVMLTFLYPSLFKGEKEQS